ncbi:MAG: hypothetical protein CVU44_10340 [Chloroflexi bacterium HGW-Chloroflexi-6]|nr:MAG: hypothetical protein CVU44_10340 [Chloroflexi bacterium HGW-Chloroflexi-6]
MIVMNNFLRLSCVLTILLVTSACVLAGNPDVDSQAVIETMVAATVQSLPSVTSAPTSTETFEPTLTQPTPTEISTETPLPTIPPLPTLTPLPTDTVMPTAKPAGGPEIGKTQGDAKFSCVVLSRIPSGLTEASAGQDIPVAWRIKNVGDRDFEKENIDYGYISGQKMAIGGTRFDLETTIPSGQAGDIIITFEAPDKAGTYNTTWALFRGSTPFCEFSFSLVVK